MAPVIVDSFCGTQTKTNLESIYFRLISLNPHSLSAHVEQSFFGC